MDRIIQGTIEKNRVEWVCLWLV